MTQLKAFFSILLVVLIETRNAYINRHLNHPLGS